MLRYHLWRKIKIYVKLLIWYGYCKKQARTNEDIIIIFEAPVFNKTNFNIVVRCASPNSQ